MKIIAIFFLFLSLSITLSIIMDLSINIPLAMSLRNMPSFWHFMRAAEYIVLAIFILIAVAIPLVFYFKKRMN